MSVSGTVAPMFSYAQAAKGLAPSPQHNSNTVSSNSSDYGNKDVTSIASTANGQTKSKTSKDLVDDLSDNKQLANGQVSTEAVESRGRSPSVEGVVESTSENHSANLTMTQDSSNVYDTKHSSVSSNQNGSVETETKILDDDTEKSSHTEEHDRSKEIDDDWEKVSVPSVAAEKELKVAPPPAVNIWQQRKEAQDAKMRELAVQRPTAATSVAKPKVQASAAREEGKRRHVPRDTGADKENTAQRRPNSGARANGSDRKEQSPSQLSPRSQSKPGEKNGTTLPAPTDTESWPTPESAIGDERRRSTTTEKAEKIDAKAASQKKWIQMPFVPTAKFETQLPPAAAARRGGRASNRGRDAANRGTHAGFNAPSTEKNENGSMGPPPPPKQSNEQDRGRKGDSARNQRASSVPTHSHRSDSVDQTVTHSTKVSTAPQRDQAAPKAQVNSQPMPVTTTAETNTPEDLQSSVQQPGDVSTSGQEIDVDVPQTTLTQSPVGGEAHSRGSAQVDRNKAVPRDEFRGSNESTDRAIPAGREWSRGRPDSTREKPDSWRERREPRPERGRGGYRGRGNHSGYNNHGQTYTAPLPQNGFETSKSYSNDSRSRQASQPFSQTPVTASSRNNPRSQSIPISVMQGAFYPPVQGFPQALSPIQGDMGYGNFSNQMPSGIMNAMPYADQLNSMALISMVVTQLEYYFSINNLCKDLFLRKNMDSQGFVPLGVIAGFKRMQALTDGQMTHEQFRNVCQQAPSIEFVTGEDGEDRIRARENWRDFILPMEERLPTAQTDGPIVRSHHRHQSAQIFQNFSGPSGHARSPPAAMNGYSEPFTPAHTATYSPPAPFDGNLPDAFSPRAESMTNDSGRRSSVTSPFGQIQSPPLQESGRKSSFVTNGHHRSVSNVALPENSFPDEKIPELKVVVRDPAVDAPQSDIANHSDAKQFNLRGGASSPQQADHSKNIRFGQASPDGEEDQTPFWTKHGRIAKVPEGPSYIHEDYLSLRDKALAQRDKNHFDGALSVLYPFWSTFLVENFNVSMYQEFVSLAAEETSSGSLNGQNHLLSFYDALLKRRTPISERIAGDLTSLYRGERKHNGKGPTFEILRITLRNGATDFKTVKRITACLTAEEKTELGV